ncbi:hypothetical protein Tco_1213586 [Tanacetum coccineum]
MERLESWDQLIQLGEAHIPPGLPTVDMKEILTRMFEDDSYKRRKRRDIPRTPPGSPPSPPPPPPPPAGASGAPGTSGVSGSSQFPPPSAPPSTASASQSMAWTTSDTRFESTDFTAAQELYLSDDEDIENISLPKSLTRDKIGGKPLPEEEKTSDSLNLLWVPFRLPKVMFAETTGPLH